MGRKGGRSFFSNLPLDLRHELRSQTLLPLIPGGDLNAVEVKAELIAAAANGDLLPTQPPSPSHQPSPEIVDQPHTSTSTSTSISTSTSTSTSTFTSASASVSTSTLARTSAPRPKKRRKVVNTPLDHPWDCTGLVQRYTSPAHFPPNLVKYWYQRHFLLPQYDRLPLLLDDTGWFSITPQPIAKHIAERCRCNVIIDAFCGVGGNAIEFAKTCERVIAIDNDPTRLRLARHNALHLGVADRIEFILGDFVEFAKKGKVVGGQVDVVFLSPPWGGTEYLGEAGSSYPLSAIQPIHGKDLFELTSTITPNIAYYLPRNVDLKQVAALAHRLPTEEEGRHREWVEVEEEWVGDKLKAITAYYGGLVAE